MTIIANSCSSLQHLSLRQCAASHLTLNTLAANCHLISMLNIAGVSSLNDTTLSNLAKNMPLLREIDASWNSSLSDIGVSALLEFCTQLNKAVLCGLKRITSQPFLAIIGDLGRWCLLEELWRYSRGSQGGAPKGKVALKTCNSVRRIDLLLEVMICMGHLFIFLEQHSVSSVKLWPVIGQCPVRIRYWSDETLDCRTCAVVALLKI